MAYELHGGPRDGQLVDDLPRGYRRVHGPRPVSAFVPIEGLPMDAAVWDAGEHRARVEGSGDERPRLRAL